MQHPSFPSCLRVEPRFEPGTVSISVAAREIIRGKYTIEISACATLLW